LGGCPHVRSAADATDNAFFFCESSTPLKSIFVIDLNHIVNHRSVKILGNKPRADSLNAMFARVSTADHRGVFWFDCKSFEVRVLFFQETCHAGDRTPGTNSCDDCINLLSTVSPDLGAGGGLVDCRIRRIFELLRHECIVSGGDELSRFVDGSLHAFSGWSQYQVGTHGAEKRAAFDGH